MADYNSVHKDKCVNEFMKLKECYLVRIFTQKGAVLLHTDLTTRKPPSNNIDRLIISSQIHFIFFYFLSFSLSLLYLVYGDSYLPSAIHNMNLHVAV